MHQSPAQLLQQYLKIYGFTPQKFADISGMPLNEVKGIIEGHLPITILRANHLAAVFKTETDLWVHGQNWSAAESPVMSEE